MYKTFKALVIITWILDIINVPAMAFLDTSLPINWLGWFLIILLLPACDRITE